MNQHAILIDFGSTFTKVAVADLAAGRMVATGRFPSTVRTDARIGLGQCFGLAKEAIGADAFEKAVKLSSSSAAGGLRMAVVGLTPIWKFFCSAADTKTAPPARCCTTPRP